MLKSIIFLKATGAVDRSMMNNLYIFESKNRPVCAPPPAVRTGRDCALECEKCDSRGRPSKLWRMRRPSAVPKHCPNGSALCPHTAAAQCSTASLCRHCFRKDTISIEQCILMQKTVKFTFFIFTTQNAGMCSSRKMFRG